MLQNNAEDMVPLTTTQIRILIIIGKSNVPAIMNSTSVVSPSVGSLAASYSTQSSSVGRVAASCSTQSSSVGSLAASCSTQSCSVDSTQQMIASEISKKSIAVNVPCNNEEATTSVTSTSMNGLNIGEMGYLLDVPVHNVPVHNVLKRKATVSKSSIIDLTNEERIPKKRGKGKFNIKIKQLFILDSKIFYSY
jgi:hypothetical protein